MTISEEAVEAAARAGYNEVRNLVNFPTRYDSAPKGTRETYALFARAALEAAAPYMQPAGGDIMTEGEVWKVKGLLHHDEFEASFSSWDSMDPEQKARTFYNEQTFLINTTLTRQRVIRSWDEAIDSKHGPETREQGETDCPEMGRNS